MQMFEMVESLFFHQGDIAVVNSFILFREHQRKNRYNPVLSRAEDYSLGDFREEVIRGICDLPEYNDPPASTSRRPSGPPTRNLDASSLITFQFTVNMDETV